MINVIAMVGTKHKGKNKQVTGLMKDEWGENNDKICWTKSKNL